MPNKSILISIDRTGDWQQYVKFLVACVKFLFDNTSNNFILISNSADLNDNWQQYVRFLATDLTSFGNDASRHSVESAESVPTASDLHDNWQQSANSLTAGAKFLFDNAASSNSMSDGSFEIQSQTGLTKVIHIHRLILAMKSNVFERMFYGALAETVMPIKVTDITGESFEAMLKYIYTDDQLCIDHSNMVELMYTSHKYDIGPLWKHCLTFAAANLKDETVLPILVQSDLLGADSLMPACYEFIGKMIATGTVSMKWFNEVFRLPPAIADAIVQLATLTADAMQDDSDAQDHLRWQIKMVRFKIRRKHDFM